MTLHERLTAADQINQARSTFYVVRVTSEKSGLRAGNRKFDTQNEE